MIGIRLDALKKLLRLGALDVTLTDWWRTILAYFLKNKKTRCVVTRRTHARCFQVNSCFAGILLFL